MSYRISFTISCPQLFQKNLHACQLKFFLHKGQISPLHSPSRAAAPALTEVLPVPIVIESSVQCLSRGRSIFTMILARFTACSML